MVAIGAGLASFAAAPLRGQTTSMGTATRRFAEWPGLQTGTRDSRQEREGLDVARTDDGEVTVVDGRDLIDAQPFCCGHHGGVYSAKRQASVPRNKFSDPQPISPSYRLDSERTIGQVAEESHFRFGAQPGAQ